MEELFLPALVALTSVVAYAVGVKALGLSRHALAWALRQALELAGLTVVFLAVNLAIGLAFILAARVLARQFISVYILNDVSVVALSALQGALFGAWRLTADAVVGRLRGTDD